MNEFGEEGQRRVVTAIIGAGPAGLLCALLCRLRWQALEDPRATWAIYVFDKRDEYLRSHRLRMDPAPYRVIAEELASPVFDQLIGFLEKNDFRPSVNELEERLLDLAEEVGVHKEQAVVGRGPDELDLPGLRRMLERSRRLRSGDRLTIVGADSVRSAVRELAAPAGPGIEETHHLVARLRVEGPGLPHRLTKVETYKLSKLLGSVIDYRLDPGGHAELDLFVAPSEHAQIETLRAHPGAPVAVGPDTLPGAPFFSQIVRRFAAGFGDGPCRLSVQSTFRLEVRYQDRVVFVRPEATVLLVGDAAMSLPYFRGMAALASCSSELSRALVDWASSSEAEAEASLLAYEDRAQEVREREVAVVRSRGRLVSLAREFVRLSAVMPFPLQEWYLSEELPSRKRGRMTAGVALNLTAALLTAAVALSTPLVGALVWAPLGWLWLAALPVQAMGGVLFAATRTHEPGENPLLGRIWRLQIASIGLVGIATTVFASVARGRVAQIFGALGWFFLGLAFVVGYALFERMESRRIEEANLS